MPVCTIVVDYLTTWLCWMWCHTFVCIQYVGHCSRMGSHFKKKHCGGCRVNRTSAEFSRDKASVLGSRGWRSAALSQLQVAAALWNSFRSQHGVARGWHLNNYYNKSCSSQTFGGKNWWVRLHWLKEEKDLSWAVTIINRPERLLNMAVLVGMFSWIKYHVSKSVKWFCVCVCSMSYHDQSDPPLIAQGALSLVTKPWYLVLQAWCLIKTNLLVLISTGFVLGGGTFYSLSPSKPKHRLFHCISSSPS